MKRYFRVHGTVEGFPILFFEKPDKRLQSVLDKAVLGPISDIWNISEILFHYGKESTVKSSIPDCPFLSTSIIALNEKAINILKPLIQKHAEFLPLSFEGKYAFHIVNPINFIDALDMQAGNLEYVVNTGSILNASKCALFRNKIPEDLHIFRVKRIEKFAVFVDEDFFNVVCASRLTGFHFSEVEITAQSKKSEENQTKSYD